MSLSLFIKRHSAWILLIGSNILFGTSYVVAKFLLQSLPITLTLTMRQGIAALVLLPLLISKRKDLHITRKDLPQLAILVLAGFVINNLLEYNGLALTIASDAALLITSESIFTAILSWLILRESFKPIVGLALLIGFVGMYLIIERSIIPNLPAGGGAFRIVGDLLIVLSLLVEAFYTVRGKKLLEAHPPVLITSAAIIGSLIFWIPVAGWQIVSTGWPQFNLITILAIIWLAIFCTAIPYLAWFQGLASVDASSASATLFIQPLVGTLLAILILHDQLTPITIVGGILIMGSVYLISRNESA